MPKNKNKKVTQAKPTKWLYKFDVNKTSVEKVTHTSTDEEGNEVSVTKEEEVTKPLECYILRPKRRVVDEAELFYGVELAKGVKAGLLTKSLINKRYTEDGGIFSKTEHEEYAALQLKLLRNEKELQKLEIKEIKEDAEKKERDQKAAELLFEMTEIRNRMQDFESIRESVFDQTADSRARNKVVLWWILNLSYIKDELEGNEIVPLFKGDSYEEKLNCYDNYEELDLEHINIAMKNFAYFISFWHNGQATTKEEFDRVKVFMDIDINANNDSGDVEKQAKEREAEAEQALKNIKEAEEAEDKVLDSENILQPEENSEAQSDSEATEENSEATEETSEATEENSEPNPDENQ